MLDGVEWLVTGCMHHSSDAQYAYSYDFVGLMRSTAWATQLQRLSCLWCCSIAVAQPYTASKRNLSTRKFIAKCTYTMYNADIAYRAECGGNFIT